MNEKLLRWNVKYCCCRCAVLHQHHDHAMPRNGKNVYCKISDQFWSSVVVSVCLALLGDDFFAQFSSWSRQSCKTGLGIDVKNSLELAWLGLVCLGLAFCSQFAFHSMTTRISPYRFSVP